MKNITFKKEERLKEILAQKQLIREVWRRLEEEELNLSKIKIKQVRKNGDVDKVVP